MNRAVRVGLCACLAAALSAGAAETQPPPKPAAASVRVEFTDNRFKVLLNGKHLFDVEDKTFTEAGKVGLWTKADSVTAFDDFAYGSRGSLNALNSPKLFCLALRHDPHGLASIGAPHSGSAAARDRRCSDCRKGNVRAL